MHRDHLIAVVGARLQDGAEYPYLSLAVLPILGDEVQTDLTDIPSLLEQLSKQVKLMETLSDHSSGCNPTAVLTNRFPSKSAEEGRKTEGALVTANV